MLKQVRDRFRVIANDDGTQSFIEPVRHIKISPALYNAFMNVHRSFSAFLDRLDEVIDHEDHKKILRDGLDAGFDLPDEESFKLEVGLMRAQLQSYNPQDRIPGALTVLLPLGTAQGFYNTMQNACGFLETYCHVFNQTEYMLWLRDLKFIQGTPYQGPNSLPAMCNVMTALSIAAQRAAQDHGAQQLPRNWTRAPSRTP